MRLMAFPSSSATLVPKALAGVKAAHPGVTVSFSEAEPPESLAALRQGVCDLAVAFTWEGTDAGRGEDDLEGLEVIDLLTDPVSVALPVDHPLAQQDVIRITELADEHWIAGCTRCRGHLLALCGAAGFTPEVSFQTEDYVAVLGLVAAGLGVALVPQLILSSIANPGVRTIPLTPASSRAVQVVTTPDLLRVPAVKATVDALCTSARELNLAEPATTVA